MKGLYTLFALFALIAFAAASDVVVLDSDNFDEVVSENDFVFVEFYAPWCGHCKRLAPDYETLATELKGEESPAVVAKVDATEATAVASQYGVRGYPTLIFFRNGNQIKYEGDRSVAAMKTFINKKSGPPTKHLTTKEDIENFVGVVAYVESEDSSAFKNWHRAATSGQLEDFALGHVTDAALSGDYKDTVVIYKDGEDAVVFPGEKITKTKVIAFVLEEGYPLLEEISQQVWQRSQSSNTPMLAVFVEDGVKEDMETATALAQKYKGKVMVSYALTSSQKQLAERWGASGTYFPTGILLNWKGSTSPTMSVFNEETEESFNADSGAAFIDAAIEDKYENYMKSEPIPENNDGPLTVLVGKNFKQIVTESKDEVFVEFYAPWCGHCKKLAPVWEELAETFEDVDHVKIAKIDATNNNLPNDINVRGYPTLIWFNANGEQVPYSGERDLKSSLTSLSPSPRRRSTSTR